MGVVDAGAPIYSVGGGAGRPGIGEEQEAAVVCHNGDEGSHFGRGSAGVMVGSDEGGALAVMGAEAALGGGGSSGRPKEEDDLVGPACELGMERGKGGTR
jgi:hypothetical protein